MLFHYFTSNTSDEKKEHKRKRKHASKESQKENRESDVSFMANKKTRTGPDSPEPQQNL